MNPIIQLQSIVKNYGEFRVLDGIDLEIQAGVTGLLGPNGAGKSTLIKVLLGLVKLTSGTGRFFGHPIGADGRAIRECVGYVPEDDCFIPGMSGVEVVQFSACLAGLPDVEALRRAHEILDFCGMKQERYREIETYSTGMRQKIKFASAIVHDPDLLILDEPTTGLDPEERDALLKRIRLLAEQHNKSVFISTHILPDVQAVCDHVVILAAGKIRMQESLETISKTKTPSVQVRVLGKPDSFLRTLTACGLDPSPSSEGGWNIAGNSHDLAKQVWQSAKETNTQIESMIPARTSLEEVFRTAVEEAKHAGT